MIHLNVQKNDTCEMINIFLVETCIKVLDFFVVGGNP